MFWADVLGRWVSRLGRLSSACPVDEGRGLLFGLAGVDLHPENEHHEEMSFT
jgi:hypothetical protein